MSRSPPPGNFLSRIVVEKLYGEFSYEIGPLDESADPRILVLYGENGTGKSTILQLLRSLLSPSNNDGHRTKLASIPFRRFDVHFKDGSVFSATRDKELIGSYLLSIAGGGEGVGIKAYIKADPNLDVRTQTWSKAEQLAYQKFMERLKNSSEEVKLLDDKRTFTRSELSPRLRHKRMMAMQDQPTGNWYVGNPDDVNEDPVFAVVSETVESIRVEALMRQRRGSGDSQSIYKNLIRKIAHGTPSNAHTPENLIARLTESELLSSQLSEIGLTNPLSHRDVIAQLSNVVPARQEALTELVSAYIESTEAWFRALKELRGLLDKFVERLNAFLHPKSVSFSVSEGLIFNSKEGKPLHVSALSSGERHLVLILSQAILRRNSTGILIIDEPELSLNIKWQRELVSAVTDCLGGGASQVILATHSIEIAAKYRKNIARLWGNRELSNEKDD